MLQEDIQAVGAHLPSDVSDARWLEDGPDAPWGTVCSVVPHGYAAYVRIFHPARSPSGRLMNWQEVADITGRTMHSLAQWQALAGVPEASNSMESAWLGEPPEIGALPVEIWYFLSKDLAEVTSPGESCFCGLWLGWGSINKLDRGGPAVQHLPQFGLPPLAGRDYLLVNTQLRNIERLALIKGFRKLPNLIWPHRHQWLLVSDIDFDSTLIGGSEALIEAIVQDPRLEAYQVQPTDSLACDSDVVNKNR